MKKLLLILCLGCTVNLSHAQDKNPQQSIQDSHHNILGYIKNGTVTNANGDFMGEFKALNGVQTVMDKDHKIIGYVQQGKVVQDANHKLLGSINSDGQGVYSVTVVNADNKTLGHINFENGAVTDNMRNLVGYEINTEVMWAAPYFFFFKF